ncbi:MAG: PPC domain-containing DNA-binding protein [Desulfobaccales bacterium]
MQYQEGSIGRVFALRLEEGERLPDSLEAFAKKQNLQAALVIYVGGAKEGSRLVVGPDASRPDVIIPLVHTLSGIQEVLAVGTLFPDDRGEPVLHLHAAAGREGGAAVGCSRSGVEVWLVGEVIMLEILGTKGRRRPEAPSGFSLLQFQE